MSLLEECLLTELLSAGVPPPEREYPFGGIGGGRKWRFDMAWPGDRVALEVQGGGWVHGRHTQPKGFENDCEKASHAAACGWRLLLVTARMIQDGRAVRLVILALGLAAASLGPGAAVGVRILTNG